MDKKSIFILQHLDRFSQIYEAYFLFYLFFKMILNKVDIF
jgi:hypothetical protein